MAKRKNTLHVVIPYISLLLSSFQALFTIIIGLEWIQLTQLATNTCKHYFFDKDTWNEVQPSCPLSLSLTHVLSSFMILLIFFR